MNPHSRGEKELLQISIVVDRDSEINLNLARELLEGFIKEFSDIDMVYKAFYFDFDNTKEGEDKLKEVKNLFKSFHKSFKPAVKALELAEVRFQTLFKAARDGILIIDKNTADIVDANNMAEKLFEKPRKELIALNASLLFIEDYEDIRKHVLELIRTEDAIPVEILIKKSDGESVPVEINANEIKIDERDLIQIIIRDITERKIAEQKLLVAYDRADFYKDLFAYDLNRILRNINKSIELLNSYLKNPKLIRHRDEVLWMIKDQALRGLNLILYVQKILDMDDSDIISMGTMEINSVVNEAVSNISNSFVEKLLEINVETIGNGLFVKSNELLLNVFESILINAAEHNDKPFVSIQIKISKEKKDNEQYYKLEFFDNGMGIPDDMKEDIFLKGYKQDESFSGMGLGLYLVKRIVKSFKGQIWVEDRIKGEYNKGSKFILLMPMAYIHNF